MEHGEITDWETCGYKGPWRGQVREDPVTGVDLKRNADSSGLPDLRVVKCQHALAIAALK